jgi:hypothetical protein
LVGLFVLIVAAVWFAPAVVAKTGLRNRFARQALADLRGTVEVGGASLGWFTPVELRDLTVKDEAGRTLVTVPTARSSKSLFALVRNPADPGEFTVENPVVEVVCEKGLTNIEAALAAYLKDDRPAGPTRTPISLKVVGGKLTVRDTDAGKAWEFDALAATVAVPRERTTPVRFTLSAVTPGKLDADLTLGESGQLKLTATDFPLDALAPLLRRSDPRLSLVGRLTTDITAEWAAGAKTTFRVEGTAAAKDVEYAGPGMNGDRLKLISVSLPLKAASDGATIRVERAELTCDVGRVAVTGAAAAASPGNLLDSPGLTLDADVDLAKVAGRLPRLLRIRDGTAVREGRLTVKVASKATPGGVTWEGEVHTSALKANRDGKELAWEQPLSVEFAGRVPPGHLPVFDKLVCRSDVVAVNAQGSPDSFRAAANVYLARLTDRLSEFVDLDGRRFDGEALVQVVAAREPDGRFKADALAKFAHLAITDRHGHGLKEPALEVRGSAAGTLSANGPVRIDSGSLGVVAGDDRFNLTLADPVADLRSFTAGKFGAKLIGDLGRWVGRVSGFVEIPRQYLFGGQATVAGTVRVEPGKLCVDRLTLAVERVRFRGAGLDLDDPKLTGAADLTVNRATGAAEFANLTVGSSVLSVVNGRLGFEPQPNGELAVSGNGDVGINLDRFGRTLRLQSDPKGSDALGGTASGPVRFRNQGDTTTSVGTLDVKNFTYGDPKQTGISEPTLKLFADGRYDQTPDRLTLTKARVERPGLACEAAGTLSKCDSVKDAAFTGTLTYDLDKLTPELRAALGGGFQATGQGGKPLSLSGSLNTPGRLTASAGFGWQVVRAYGFEVGPGELTGKLANGTLTFTPLSATFAGGRVTVAPTIRLDPEPAEMTLAAGKVVDHAKLTPQTCAGAIGYALPVIANAAQAEGEMSVTLENARVPLADSMKAAAKGVVHVHRAEVGAGPVVGEIAKLLGTPNPKVVLVTELPVPVRVEAGRVYHENLRLTVNGFAVTTAGSVGFDGTLAMTAEVPVPAGLIKNNPRLMTALNGKTVKVPIAGTLAHPAIDPRWFQAEVERLARDAAKGVGKDLLNKELEKLFPKK